MSKVGPRASSSSSNGRNAGSRTRTISKGSTNPTTGVSTVRCARSPGGLRFVLSFDDRLGTFVFRVASSVSVCSFSSGWLRCLSHLFAHRSPPARGSRGLEVSMWPLSDKTQQKMSRRLFTCNLWGEDGAICRRSCSRRSTLPPFVGIQSMLSFFAS